MNSGGGIPDEIEFAFIVIFVGVIVVGTWNLILFLSRKGK
jgi:hypothetical protein